MFNCFSFAQKYTAQVNTGYIITIYTGGCRARIRVVLWYAYYQFNYQQFGRNPATSCYLSDDFLIVETALAIACYLQV